MPIFDQNDNTAILTPDELHNLIRAIPRNSDKDKFEVLLYTGCRYTELQNVHGKYHRLRNNCISIENTKELARKKEKFRWVVLNRQGLRALNNYFNGSPLPTRAAWWQNLKRWCKIAGIDTRGIGVKTTRKTWESYLVMTFPHLTTNVFKSQGHSAMTSIKYYLSLPFTAEEKRQMLYFTEGWDNEVFTTPVQSENKQEQHWKRY